MERIIMHIDVNNAFLSFTAVEMLKNGNYDIRKEVSVIGGDETKRRGIVLAKSMYAKKLGIVTGETLYSARKKYRNLKVYPPNHELYKKMSNALFSYIKRITSDIEQVSVDECFLDYGKVKNLYGDELVFAHKLKNTIYKKFGFTVNIGIANNKLCAKMASDFEKPNKVHTLYPEEVPQKMWPLPVRDLLFLGKASEKKLVQNGIRTIGDLARANEKEIQMLLGEKAGHQLYLSANGIDDSPVKAQREEAKGISVETTFDEDIVSYEQIFPILLSQCDIVAARMRREGKKCNCVAVSFRTLEFKNKSHQRKLDNPTDVTNEIYQNVRQLFQESWSGQPLRLIGVALTGLTEDDFIQMSLFEDPKKREQQKKLDEAMDNIRKKFGNDKISRASTMNVSGRIARKAKAQMENGRKKNDEQ